LHASYKEIKNKLDSKNQNFFTSLKYTVHWFLGIIIIIIYFY